MASKYWIKLYHEILEDPKMGRLDDSAWRLAIECFLMAGEVDQDGLLGTTEDIAWKLRRPCNETLHELLRKLNAYNILVLRNEKTWFVKNFAKRQEAVSGAERVRQYRKRQSQDGLGSAISTKKEVATRNESVTKSYTDTDTDTDTDEMKKSFPPKPNGKGNLSLADPEALAGAIGQLCKVDLAIASPRMVERVKGAVVRLLPQGVDEKEIKDFTSWWLASDWRGQKGDPPTPEQVCDLWPRFRGAKLNGSPISKLTDDQMAAYKRMRKNDEQM